MLLDEGKATSREGVSEYVLFRTDADRVKVDVPLQAQREDLAEEHLGLRVTDGALA